MLDKNIKYLRESHGMTQSDLANIVGVTDKAVSTWENGTYQPRIGVIEKLASYFSIPKSALLDTDMSQDNACTKKPIIAEDDGLTAIKRDFINDLLRLSDEDIQSLRPVVKSLLKNSNKADR